MRLLPGGGNSELVEDSCPPERRGGKERKKEGKGKGRITPHVRLWESETEQTDATIRKKCADDTLGKHVRPATSCC